MDTINQQIKKCHPVINIVSMMICFMIIFTVSPQAQSLQGFSATGTFEEQEMTITNQWPNVIININAPQAFHTGGKTYLIFYALPNGNSIAWTKGKKIDTSEDWHFDIQHIAAQTRYIRSTDSNNNYIIAFLMATQKSWPAWKRSTPDSVYIIKQIVDSIVTMFSGLHPSIALCSHSGGGSFIFGYIDAVNKIPANVERIAFIDSEYGYVDSTHSIKLSNWLQGNHNSKLVALAYNDSVVIYNGKPLVSPTGGTWYRSGLMQRNLAALFHFTTSTDTAFITHTALNGRINMIFKKNPGGLIYHTEQVARNGFILAIFSATKFDRRKYFTYFGDRVYKNYIGR